MIFYSKPEVFLLRNPARKAPFTVLNAIARSDILEKTVFTLSKQNGLVQAPKVERIDSPFYQLPREQTCYKLTVKTDQEIAVAGHQIGIGDNKVFTLSHSQLGALDW